MTGVVEQRERTYYTPREVAEHNSPNEDCWVSFLGRVYDITSLLKENLGPPQPTSLCASATQFLVHAAAAVRVAARCISVR